MLQTYDLIAFPLKDISHASLAYLFRNAQLNFSKAVKNVRLMSEILTMYVYVYDTKNGT